MGGTSEIITAPTIMALQKKVCAWTRKGLFVSLRRIRTVAPAYLFMPEDSSGMKHMPANRASLSSILGPWPVHLYTTILRHSRRSFRTDARESCGAAL